MRKLVLHVRNAAGMLFEKTQKGRKYYGCEDNPECDFMSWQKPSDKKCPVCGSYMVEKETSWCAAMRPAVMWSRKTKQED